MRWLRQGLTRALGLSSAAGEAPAADDGLYDQSMGVLVRRFQSARGLSVDGLVGRETTMALNDALAGDSVPRLRGGGH